MALQVAELKTKVQKQEIVLSALLKEKKEWKAAPVDSDVLINTNNQSPVAVNGLPSSCADLKMIGHIWNGFYSVMGNTTMESVYCDFTKLPSDAGNLDYSAYIFVDFYFLRNHSFFIFKKISKNGSDTRTSNQHLYISMPLELVNTTLLVESQLLSIPLS